jgi:Zn ribbon nucleic-acid-binding protein
MMDRCPLCQSDDYTQVYTVKDLPLFQNKVYDSVSEARSAPTGTIELIHCVNCGFIYNRSFDNRLMIYDQTYQNEQNYSGYFQNYLNEIIELFHKEGLIDGKSVEIGSGKGYFLNLMEQSGADIMGFDPAYDGGNPHIIKEYFSPKHTGIRADTVILRHTLEHIGDPFQFVHLIAEINNHHGKIYIEVPSFEWINARNAFWDIAYEHCNYFRESVLKAMFKKSKTGLLFNGQYLYVIAELRDLKEGIRGSRSYPSEFKPIFVEKLAEYGRILAKSQRNTVWGAGGKGSTFVNMLDPEAKLIKYLVDINPKKQNKYLAKSAHPILSPASLVNEMTASTVFIMNENYLAEIQKELENRQITFIVL